MKTTADPEKVQVLYALYCAEAVLPLFEEAYPQDLRPRKCIETAKIALKNPTKENKEAVREVAWAARAAARNAAGAAALAAWAAWAAARNAAWAAGDAALEAAGAIEYAKKAAQEAHKNIDFDSLLSNAEEDIWDYIQKTGRIP